MVVKTIFVLNCGSSSVKFQLRDPDQSAALVQGAVTGIGEPQGNIQCSSASGSERFDDQIPDHRSAVLLIMQLCRARGFDFAVHPPQAVGHRVVHGGPDLSVPTIITPVVEQKIVEAQKLAPLHNPAHLIGIRLFRDLLPSVPAIAVFDTGFFSDLPAVSRRYSITREIADQYALYRYGAHGTSHAYVSRMTARQCSDPETARMIIAHLGNGASVSAVIGRKAVDISMGVTPLEGIMMGSRCGSIDPSIVMILQKQAHMSVDEVDDLLQRQSGLLGLAGSNDLRVVKRRADAGDRLASEAIDIYVHSLQKQIGAYWFVLGSVDAIAFTAGVGENADWLRERIFSAVASWGVAIDPVRNADPKKYAGRIHADHSQVRVFVVPTEEEHEIARACAQLLSKQ